MSSCLLNSFAYFRAIKTDVSHKILACKVVLFGGGGVNREDVEKECHILSELNHPNIIGYVDRHVELSEVKLYMEFCPEGSLQDLVDYNLR
jgi:serine/threonine protein kinase